MGRNRFVGRSLRSVVAAMITTLALVTTSHATFLLQQCKNDPDNNGVADACTWTNQEVNGSNSTYCEGDAIPQRLFHKISGSANQTHTIRLRYQFTSSHTYGYDFLGNLNGTVGSTDLNA